MKELGAADLLFKSIGLLTAIIKSLPDTIGNSIIEDLINNNYIGAVDTLNQIKEDLNNDRQSLDTEQLITLVLIDNYISDLHMTLYIVNDLFIHKQENGFVHVQSVIAKTLEKYDIANSQQIGEEIYLNIIDKKNTKSNIISKRLTPEQVFEQTLVKNSTKRKRG